MRNIFLDNFLNVNYCVVIFNNMKYGSSSHVNPSPDRNLASSESDITVPKKIRIVSKNDSVPVGVMGC